MAKKTVQERSLALERFLRGQMAMKKISGEKLAAATGLNKNTIYAKLNDVSKMQLGTLLTICDVLEISRNDLYAVL